MFWNTYIPLAFKLCGEYKNRLHTAQAYTITHGMPCYMLLVFMRTDIILSKDRDITEDGV